MTRAFSPLRDRCLWRRRELLHGLPVRAILLLGLALSASCGRERSGDPSLEIVVRVSPTPATVGPNRILVELPSLPPESLERARVTVTATLPGEPFEVGETAHREGRGPHVIPAMVFPAGGEWTLTVRAEVPGGAWAEIQRPLRVVGNGR